MEESYTNREYFKDISLLLPDGARWGQELFFTFAHVSSPCSVRATISGGRVATKIPATGIKEATKVSMLKNPRPDICSRVVGWDSQVINGVGLGSGRRNQADSRQEIGKRSEAE
jgi:hypothetical protein